MILTVYNYNYQIPVTMSRYSGQLGNVTMFDDTLVLHKNMNNVFQLNITDRDRVRLKVTEETPIQVKFRIISEDGVVVSMFYLSFKETGNFWEFIIPKDEVNKLDTGDGYNFTATLHEFDDMGNSQETPLYVDHNFKLMGRIDVHDNFFDIETEIFTTTEPLVDHYLNDEREFEAKHFFIDHLYNDGNLYHVEVRYIEPEPVYDDDGVLVPNVPDRCSVTLEKNMQTHYPINPRNEQWNAVATFYGVGVEDTTIDFSKIDERTYARVIIHTERPENFELVVHKITQ